MLLPNNLPELPGPTAMTLKLGNQDGGPGQF
jgi:hypothetical protein